MLTRSTPLRRTPFKRKPAPKKSKPRSAEHRADDLFSLRIRARDGHRCRRCGSGWRLDAAHVIRRGFHAVRWVEENAVALCRGCHDYMGAHEFEWLAWCIAEGIPYDNLRWRALHDEPERAEDALARLRAAA